VAKVAASTGQDFGFLMDSLVTGVGRLSPAILDNLSIQASLSEATARAAEMFGVEEDELTKAQTQAGMMSVVMEKLAENTAAMPSVAGTAAAGMAGLKARLQDAKDSVGTAFLPTLNALIDNLLPLAVLILPLVTEAVGNLSTVIVPLAEEFGVFVNRLANGVDPLVAFQALLMRLLPEELHGKIAEIRHQVEAFIAQAEAVAGPILAWVKDNVELKDVLTALGVAIAAVVIPALASVVASVAPVIAAGVALVAAVAAIRQAWETDFLGIRTTVENALAAISALGEHGAAIMAKAQEIWEAVVSVFEWAVGQYAEVFAAFKSAFEGDWYGFGEHLRNVWDEVWGKIVEIGQIAWQNIHDFFTGTDWGAVARAIIDGIAAGIRNGAAALADAARAAAQAALDAAKGFLGIDSPSRAFIRVGQAASAGFARGLQEVGPVERAAAQMGTAALSSAERAVTRIEAPVTINATVASGLDIEDLAWRVSEIIGARLYDYAV